MQKQSGWITFRNNKKKNQPKPNTNRKSYLLLPLKNLREEFSESNWFCSCLDYFYFNSLKKWRDLFFFSWPPLFTELEVDHSFLSHSFLSGWYLIYTQEEKPEEESTSKNEFVLLQSFTVLLWWILRRVFVLVHGDIYALKNNLSLMSFFLGSICGKNTSGNALWNNTCFL